MLVTKQDLLDFMREKAYKPMTVHELESHFGASGADDFKALVTLLNEMEQEGEVLRTRTNRYGVPERMNLIKGRIQAHPKGFGFLIPEDRDHPDIYIHANDMKGAMQNDIVLGRVTGRSGPNGTRLEGEVVRIVKRANDKIVGIFENHDSYGFIIPDDKRIQKDVFVRKENFKGAVTGQKVVAKLISFPDGRSAAEGEIIEILGHKDDPGVDILSIIRKYGLPETFPPEVMQEAEDIPDEIRETDLIGRRDLRDRTIITIDGEDAKDLDDAVDVRKLENGNYLLGVHIADVAYYVKEGSAIDREALNRGTSVYLVDRVIPMLPHRLSNGICSLNPHADRLTLSCEMEIDPSGRIVSHDIFPSVIRTAERMTYENVRLLLDEEEETPPELSERYRDLVPMLELMRELALILRGKRRRRGAIDFDFAEAKVIVDEEGKPIDIVKQTRSIAEMIIEEFMLAANETVAEHFHWLKIPFLFRVHEDPDNEKLMHFMQFISNFGYIVKGRGNTVHPRALQTLLEEIKGTKEETVISTVLLRSMKQARYDPEPLGHFGLATEYYCHFTAPIRRYPDLVIHRIIRETIANGGSLSEHRHDWYASRMPEIAQHSSERERLAVDAERETDALKKAEFMLDKIGEEFEGIISSVTSFGMFVELENTVEGLVRLSDMTDDYYHFHEFQLALIGERTAKMFRVGDEVRVRVTRVNLDERNIDFELVDMKPRASQRPSVIGERRGAAADSGGGRASRKKKRRAKVIALDELADWEEMTADELADLWGNETDDAGLARPGKRASRASLGTGGGKRKKAKGGGKKRRGASAMAEAAEELAPSLKKRWKKKRSKR